MEARRTSRIPIDPKVRQVGFFAPGALRDRSQSGPLGFSSSPPVSNISPAGNSLSPVMIPPPRHASDNFVLSRPLAVPVSASTFRPPAVEDRMAVGSYDASELLLGTSASSRIGDGEFSEDYSVFFRRSSSGKFASSLPSGGFDSTAMKINPPAVVPAVKKPAAKKPAAVIEKSGGAVAEMQIELPTSSKPLKEKTTKAERRALQESQRAAKAAAKDPISGGNKPAAASVAATPMKEKASKAVKQVPSSVAASDKKGGERIPEKDKKKDVPPPRMQFDDKNRVEKAKRHAVVKPTEARNRVELFRHLSQYEHGTQLPKLESRFFQLDPVHPAVQKVGFQYLAGDIVGGNARCIAMLRAFQEAIKDYSMPPEKTLARDLTAKISSYVSFLNECRPLSISMGNSIRFLKNRIAKLPLTVSESEAKDALYSDIDRFINEKIVLADKVIVRHAATKIRDGDVLLTYGFSCVVEMTMLYAHELGRQFRVVVVDSHPKFEGQALLRRLVEKGLSCSYTHINAVSYIMHEVTRVFLGAASIFSNGTVYSRVGTACVAMVAHAFRVPVLICCEAYKFHERVQLDSICSNELGDPDVISKVAGRADVNYLDNWRDKENLQLLNLIYDATPSDYVSMIITDYGMVPPTSVPVIVREYREHLWI